MFAFLIYCIVVIVITLVALFTRGWTKWIIVGLVIAWIPIIIFTVSLFGLLLNLKGYNPITLLFNPLVFPLVLILLLIFIVFKLMDYFF